MNLLSVANNIIAESVMQLGNLHRQKMISFQKQLSTGKQINSASDDAAGLSISNKLETQVRGLQQANKNIQDGISMIQNVESSISSVQSICQRARELSVQAANDTLTTEDREMIQMEIDQLLEEIDSIANTSVFNTMTLLNGSNDIPSVLITTQTDFSNGASSQSGGVDQLDFSTIPGSVILSTEPFETDIQHTDPGNEDYIDIFRTGVTSLGNGLYNVQLSVRFRSDTAANNYTGSFELNNAILNNVVNAGCDSAVQNGNQVDFTVNLTDAEGLAGFDIDFDTTDTDSSFDLQLNNPTNESINTYFDNNLIQSGVPPYSASKLFEPLFSTGTYTSDKIDLQDATGVSISIDDSKPTGTSIVYGIQTSETGEEGTWSASQTFTPGPSISVDNRYIRITALLSSPSTYAENGISPELKSITVNPRGKTINLHDGSNNNTPMDLSMPDVRTTEINLQDIDVTLEKGAVLASETQNTIQQFETGTITNLTTSLNNVLELATEPFGTETPGGTVGQERYISVSRTASVINADNTVTSKIRIVTGSDAAAPLDNPGGVIAQSTQTRFTGKLRILDGQGNPLSGALNGSSLSPISLEGYDPGGDGNPPFVHGTTSPNPSANDDIVNGPVNGGDDTIDEDGYVNFDISTVGVQDGFDIEFTAKPDARFELYDIVAKDKPGGGAELDVPVNIYFGDILVGMVDSTGGPQSVSQAFEKRETSGMLETEVMDLGAGGLNRVQYNGSTPGNTSISVAYQTSSDGINFLNYQSVENGGTFRSDEDQRYVRLKITMTGDSSNKYISPSLESFTVERIAPSSGAELAIRDFTTAINTLSEYRAKLGAKQQRLEHSFNFNSIAREEQQIAQSRIEDTDMAEVMSEYIREQLLDQTSMAMMIQANLLPQTILKLFQ